MELQIEHQKIFKFQDVTISSKFPSGNLAKCQESQPNNFNIWIGNDPNSKYKTWFYFSVEGVPKKNTITFTIKNMSNQSKIYKQGLLPVFKQEGSSWEKIKIPVLASSFATSTNGFEFQFKHYFQNESKVYFAFTYPWTLNDWDVLYAELEKYCRDTKQIYFNRSIIAYSIQKRPVQVITITRAQELEKNYQIPKGYSDLFKNDNVPLLFQNKKGIMISARVHPGEVPSSHILNGFIKQLMNSTPQRDELLKKCVLYLIPFINPDGVQNGLYRSDTQGQNLNRFYANPNQQLQPEIFGIKKFVVQMVKNKKMECCLDLHAHAAKKGCFIYGNSITDLEKQLEVCLFPKILSINNDDFDYDACNFTETNMYQKDKGDEMSKQGAARVSLYKATDLHKCWTLEVNYNTGRFKNKIFQKGSLGEKFNINSIKKGIVLDYFGQDNIPMAGYYNIQSFQKIGKGILQSFVDYFELLPNISRLNNTPFKNIKTLKLNIAVSILRMIPFKFDQNTRKILHKLNQQQTVFEGLKKLSTTINLTLIPGIPNQKNKLQDVKKNQPKTLNSILIPKQNKNPCKQGTRSSSIRRSSVICLKKN